MAVAQHELHAPLQHEFGAGLDGDNRAAAELPPDVAAFLAAGPAPVLFTAGTANAASHEFFATSVAAAQLGGWRALLLTQDAPQLPASLPAGVAHFSYVPFPALLPRVAALVHHGGVGTTSQALRAGVPQLIRPMGFDQYDNALRALHLGVAQQLLPRHYIAPRVVQALRHLLGDAAVPARCAQVAQQMVADLAAGQGIAAVCDAVLALPNRHVPIAPPG